MAMADTGTDGDASRRADASSRRAFVASAGRLALLTPPTVTLLLTTSMNAPAVALAGGTCKTLLNCAVPDTTPGGGRGGGGSCSNLLACLADWIFD